MIYELITKAVIENNIRVLSVIPQCLFNEVDSTFINFIYDYLQRYGCLPSIEILMNECKDFRDKTLEVKDLPLKYIFEKATEKLQTDYIKLQMVEAKKEGKLYDPIFLSKLYNEVRIGNLSSIVFSEFDRNEHYLEDNDRLSFGISWFDEQLAGLVPGDLLYFFGRMKSNKTTFWLLIQLLLVKQGYKVLACSNEMTNIQLIQKHDAMLGGFNPMVFRKQDFTPEIKQKIAGIKDQIKDTGGDIHFVGYVNSPADVLSEFINCPFEPDIIMIDGANKMGTVASDSSGQSLSQKAVSNGLSQIALENNVPVIAVTHAKRGSGKSDELGADDVSWSDELAKDCTGLVGFSIIESNGKNYVKINVAANRFGETGNKIYALIDWDTMKVTFHENEMGNATFSISTFDNIIKDVKMENSLSPLELYFAGRSETQIKEHFISYKNKSTNILLIELKDTSFLAYVKDNELQDIIKLNDGSMGMGEVNVDTIKELEEDDRLILMMVNSDEFNTESD